MDNNNIRAILKPNGYKADQPFGLKEKLMEYDYSPMIAYGEDKGSHIEYESATDADAHKIKLAEIKKIALANNAKIEVQFSIQEIEGDKLFLVEPHEYAAEKILDKAFLSVVEKQLGSDTFLVGIPHQGVFAAVSSMSNFKGKFLGFIKQKFENPEANQITPHVFEVHKGEIVSVGGEDTGSNKNTISQKANGDLIVEMESETFEDFQGQVSAGYTQVMLLAVKTKGFSGNIIFNENNAGFNFDEKVLARCSDFIQKIEENEMAQTVVKAMVGNGIVPTFAQAGKPISIKRDSAAPLQTKEQASQNNVQPSQNMEAPSQAPSQARAQSSPDKKWWQFWK